MEFLGTIEYGSQFVWDLLKGVLLSIPALLVLGMGVRSTTVRLVGVWFVVVYILPTYIVRTAAEFPASPLVPVITYLFLLAAIAGFLIAAGRGLAGMEPGRFLPIGTILLVGLIVYSVAYVGLAVWFGLNPSTSGALVAMDVVTNGEGPRFAFYGAPSVVQLAFALMFRVITPTVALVAHLAGRAGIRSAVLISAVPLAIQSAERQNLFLLFAVACVAVVVGRKGRMSAIIDASVALTGLIVVFSFQGNLGSDTLSAITVAPIVGQIVFRRVVVDSNYMLAHIMFFFPNVLPLGLTNRILGAVGLGYAAGFSAIGLLADLWLNFRWLGIVLGGFGFGVAMGLASRLLDQIRHSLFQPLIAFLFLLAFGSFFYSNTLSVIPIMILLFATGTGLMISSTLASAQSRPTSGAPPARSSGGDG